MLNANSANGTVVADAIGAAQAWASTGGPSQFESEPSYQLPFQSTGYRTTPDVSFDASQNSGVTCFQDGSLGYGYFGTSLSSPCWAGLIAIANQGRVADGGTTLNSTANPMQTLQALYSLPASDFNDITTGYNGFSAGAGYDEVTGRGTPIANLLIPDLASYGLPTKLAITTQPPASVTAGSTFGLAVTVEDRIGDVITSYNGSVTIALSNNPGAGTLGGTLTVTAVNGVATFSGLILNAAGIGYTLTASSGSLIKTTTTPINVTAAAASKLIVTTQPPSSVTAGSSFGLTITAEDQYGNLATSFNSTVTIALGSNPGSSTLGGILTVTAVNGVATFSKLTLNKVGTGYTLKATGSPATATTSGINVTAAAASSLAFSGLPATATVGTAFGFTVTAYDPYGNVATGYTGTVHFTSSDTGASLPANYTFTSGNAGTYSFSATLNTSGPQTITATDTVTSSITGQGSLTVSTANTTTSATFLKQDTKTGGNWIGVYGTDGYEIINNPSTTNPNSLPAGVTITPTGATAYTWANPSTATPALEVPGGASRIAATWYASPASRWTWT